MSSLWLCHGLSLHVCVCVLVARFAVRGVIQLTKIVEGLPRSACLSRGIAKGRGLRRRGCCGRGSSGIVLANVLSALSPPTRGCGTLGRRSLVGKGGQKREQQFRIRFVYCNFCAAVSCGNSCSCTCSITFCCNYELAKFIKFLKGMGA